MTRSQRVGGASRVSRRWLLAGTAGMAAAGTALSAAACSPPGGSGGAAPGGAGASIRPGTTLRLYDGVSGTLVEPYSEILAQFTARTGAKVEADPPVSSGVWNEVLLSQVSGGTAPDVSVGYGNELFFFIDNGAATDITQRVARDVPKADFDDWLPSQVQMFKRNGKQYALPKYCGTSAFYYNKTMFNQAGVPFPDDKMTWMQYREKLVALTKSDGATNTTFGLSHNSAAHLGYIMSWMVWSWGGEVTDPQDDSKCLLDQPPALEALQFWQDLRWKYHVLPTPDEGAALGSGNLFSRSIAATERNGSWLIPTYQMDNPALQWDVFPNPLGPTGKRATFHTTDGYLMFNNSASKAPDAAWQLLRFVTSPEWGRMLIRTRQRQPARRSLAPEWIKTTNEVAPSSKEANLEVFVKGFEYARPQHSFSNNPKAYEILDPVLDAVYNKNEISASQAFREAAPKVTQLLQSLKR